MKFISFQNVGETLQIQTGNSINAVSEKWLDTNVLNNQTINAQQSQSVVFQQYQCENHINRAFSFSSPDMMMRLCWW